MDHGAGWTGGGDSPGNERVEALLGNVEWAGNGRPHGDLQRNYDAAVGGFDETFYASEEIWLSKALRERGRFVIVRHPVLTSGRKLRMNSALSMLATALVLLLKGPRSWQRRDGLDLWYDGRREHTSG